MEPERSNLSRRSPNPSVTRQGQGNRQAPEGKGQAVEQSSSENARGDFLPILDDIPGGMPDEALKEPPNISLEQLERISLSGSPLLQPSPYKESEQHVEDFTTATDKRPTTLEPKTFQDFVSLKNQILERDREPPVTKSTQKQSSKKRQQARTKSGDDSVEKIHEYNTAEIRKLMTECYRDEDLNDISFDYFRPVYDSFGSGMGKDRKIHILLEYAERYIKMNDLLLALWETNKECYEKHLPNIGVPQRIPRENKIIVVIVPPDQVTKEGIAKIIKSLADEANVPPAEAQAVITESKFTTIISIPTLETDRLQELSEQRHLESLKTEYGVDTIKVANNQIKLSSSSNNLAGQEAKLKSEVANKLGISPQEIKFEYDNSMLIMIALPGEKADLLLKLDQEGKLEKWKKRLGIKQLKPENNLDRYIQLVATLTPPAKTSILKKADALRKNIARVLRADWKQIRLLSWESRFLTFMLVLPSQAAAKLKANNLDDLDILQLKTIYMRKDKEVIHATLVSAIDNSNANVSYSRNHLAQKLSFEIAKKLCFEPNEVEISWLHDSVSFSFVLPSRFAAILLYYHSTGKLKRFLDFEIKSLKIGQYDWDNYLGLVPVTA